MGLHGGMHTFTIYNKIFCFQKYIFPVEFLNKPQTLKLQTLNPKNFKPKKNPTPNPKPYKLTTPNHQNTTSKYQIEPKIFFQT